MSRVAPLFCRATPRHKPVPLQGAGACPYTCREVVTSQVVRQGQSSHFRGALHSLSEATLYQVQCEGWLKSAGGGC